MNYKRITIFAGHYGSGKTNIAVNYALMLKENEKSVSIADLDIVNPYFRTKDSEEMLSEHGIRLICSEYANSNVDVPALPADAYAVVDNKDMYAVLDVGGDDRGALALGRYIESIKEENDYEMLFVINKYRPLTPDADSTIEIMHEIEDACKTKFTGIVNNSNLGDETTAENVLSSLDYAKEVSEKTGLPIRFTAVKSSLYSELSDKIENIFNLKLFVKQTWSKQEGNMPKVTFRTERCKGCGLCVDACPKKIVKLDESINAKGYHPACITDQSQCIGCAFCATMCPDCVIKVEKEDK